MTEVKDPEIMLFGKRISIPPVTVVDCGEFEQQKRLFFYSGNSLVSKITSADRVGDEKDDNKKSSQSELTAARLKDPATSSDHNPKTPSFDKEHYNNVEQSETSVSQEQTLKKPDKILPCPRCSSMDTKFCYYNNYNVSQPRHFCKNCQRYWTAGGSMRNVPVGSGRRKNKNPFSALHYRHIMGSEANGIHCPNSRTDGTILTFGSDSPHSDSASFPLNMAEKSHRIPVGGEEFSESDSAEKGGNSGFEESVMKNSQNFPGQIPCFSMPPWSAFPPAAFSPPGFPAQFYQTQPYWGGCSLPGPWNVPWFFPSNPNSSTLGKHSREGEMLTPNSEKEEPLRENDSERGVWIPKTLRIHDPSEAAKSSIWSTLGTKNEKNCLINGGGLFKSFQSKVNERNHRNSTSIALHANPAALSRSLNFHESA